MGVTVYDSFAEAVELDYDPSLDGVEHEEFKDPYQQRTLMGLVPPPPQFYMEARGVTKPAQLNPYGTTPRASGSIAMVDAAGGKARWSEARRGQIRHELPIGVAPPPVASASA